MRYKKQIIFGLILLIIFVGLFLNKTKVNRKIAKDLEIKVPYTLDFCFTDSHGGFFGDGIALGRAEINYKDIDILLKDSEGHWTKTPIPEELNEMLFMDESFNSNFATRLSMNNIENGYWMYVDRFGNKKEYLNEEQIGRPTGNYSIGLLDLDQKKFYYIKFDS